MLKIYTDSTFLNETYRRRLFPLLFDICILKNQELTNYYTLVNEPKEADVFICPINYQEFMTHKDALLAFKKNVKKYNKPVWIYTSGDFGYTIKENYYNFRLGGFKSKLNANSFILPSFVNDPYSKIEQNFVTVSKKTKPNIGFVGHAKSGANKYIKEVSIHLKIQLKQRLKNIKNDKQSFYPSGSKRANYLQKLMKSNVIDTNFILREQYRAGVKTEAEKLKTTEEFYNNMFNNAYTFCIRGAGNFSVRLYETLAMGRIPVLINTDCKLPLEDSVNWSKHAFIINEKEINKLNTKLVEFHNSFTQESFEKIQISNRDLWLNKLERVSYFKQIYNKFNV